MTGAAVAREMRSAGSASLATGAPFASTNGRVWKMVLDPSDPTKVTSLSILIEGDDHPVKTLDEIHQPDNLETSSQQFVVADQGLPNGTTARIWQYDYTSTGDPLGVVAKVDQSADEGTTDNDLATSAGRWGEWESSGIIDVSSIFGPGKFLVTVQAHTSGSTRPMVRTTLPRLAPRTGPGSERAVSFC